MNAKSIGIVSLLFCLCLFMMFMTAEPWYDVTGSKFLQPNNIQNLLSRTAMYGVLGIGVAFVIITGGIDLSIGSVVCLAACLLAVFLQVDYVSPQTHDVYRINATKNQILVVGDATSYQSGDMLRLYGLNRGTTALVRVESVELVRVDREGELVLGSQIDVQGSLPSDTTQAGGKVSKVYAVTSYERQKGAQPATITLPDEALQLRRRDQLLLAGESSGLQTVEIVAAQQSTYTLGRDLDPQFNDQWLAIPLVRQQRMPIPVAVGAVLLIAAGLGLLHGLLITRMGLQPFVVTLCGLLVYRGIARWLVSDKPPGFGKEYDETLRPLANGRHEIWHWQHQGVEESFGVPYAFYILLFVAVIAAIYLNRTIWGRYTLALGRNEEAARYSGINTSLITILAYMICTVSAAVGGMLFALNSNSVSPSSFGSFYELYAIAAAVLGGCSLRGGEGTIIGVIAGTAVMQVLYNLILLMGIPDQLEYAIIGMVILLGVSVDEVVRRLAVSQRAKNRSASSAA